MLCGERRRQNRIVRGECECDCEFEKSSVKLEIVSRWVGLEGGAIIGVFKGKIDVSDPLRNRSVCVCLCICSSAAALQSISASGPFATPLSYIYVGYSVWATLKVCGCYLVPFSSTSWIFTRELVLH